MSNFSKRRQSSSSSMENPFDIPDNYYGPKTNPSGAPWNPKLGRARTLSLIENKQLFRHSLLDDTDDDEDPRLQTLARPVTVADGSDNLDEDSEFEPPLSFPFRQPGRLLDALSERSQETSPDPASSTDLPAQLGFSELQPSAFASGTTFPPESSSELGTPFPNGRRPSIVPLYGDLSNESLPDIPPPHAHSTNYVPHSVAKHIGREHQLKRAGHSRRVSLDEGAILTPKKFYISDIDMTLKQLLANEDTDHNYQITIEDTGPKVLKLGTLNSNGYRNAAVRGTYMLSNLLQELTIAKRMGRSQMILDEARLNENPVDRLRRLITTQFWKSLSREVNEHNIAAMARDTKIPEDIIDEETGKVIGQTSSSHRLYVPFDREDQYDYYCRIRDMNPSLDLEVAYLPEVIDADYIKSINKKPGLLSLATCRDPNDPTKLISQPYVVPGGRFNELYGWDSYMETLGLLVTATLKNPETLRLSRGMAENFIFEIRNYGKILNANRSYYLGRSQPPFLTDMSIRIYNKTLEIFAEDEERLEDVKGFLLRATSAAIKEYETVWVAEPRLDKKTGLSCYHPSGKGVPPETEPTHFDSVLEPYAVKYKVSKEDFITMYNDGQVSEPKLDEYFLHDRAVRESGHDTSYRLEGKAAYLATVDLNSLLYKYEIDIAYLLETFFAKDFPNESANKWRERAHQRKLNVEKYLWSEEDGMFYDYNIKTEQMTGYESATTFWPLWSNLATPEQAAKLVEHALPKFEEYGGLVSGTLKSRGKIGISRPSRQWDFPYGWAPQQILAWIGFQNYGYDGVARRLSYRWLYLMTQAFVDFNGIVVEKYDVTQRIAPHKVDAEYGNQGSDFKGVATEGFGWVNASYVLGLSFATLHVRRCLGTLTPPDVFLANLNPAQVELYGDGLSE